MCVLIVCELETAKMRQPRPDLGCGSTEEEEEEEEEEGDEECGKGCARKRSLPNLRYYCSFNRKD